MKKIYRLFVIFVFFTGLVSCEDYLNEEPLYQLTDQNAVTDYNTASLAVKGIYTKMLADYTNGYLYCALASKAGLVRISATDLAMSYTAESPGSGQYTFRTAYYIVNAANFAINRVNALDESFFPTATAKKALIGEARALRANANLILLWNYGHWWAADDNIYGILYRDEQADVGNLQVARLTVGESYKKIYEDLDFAIANMNSFTTNRYFSKQYVQILKAKALLYRGAYHNVNNATAMQEALTLVNSVLDNPPAGFQMESNMKDLYDITKVSWDSKENLFALYREDGAHDTPSQYYSYRLAQYANNREDRDPLHLVEDAGVIYLLDEYKADPRWKIATSWVPGPSTSYAKFNWFCFSKLYRMGDGVGPGLGAPANCYTAYHFRFAELYILKAELLARTGASVAAAIAPINVMRSKRTNPVLPALNPVSQQELMDLIFKEYFFELSLENGCEFFASTRFMKDGVPYIEATRGTLVNENLLCWPIPLGEMTYNKAMIQNFGY